MTNVVLDSDFWLVDSVVSITHEFALDAQSMSTPALKVHPNPAADTWIVEALRPNSTLTLSDVTGRVIWQTNNGINSAINVPAHRLATGLYLLRVSGSDGKATMCKLVKE